MPDTYARFTTSAGNFTVRLFAQEVPKTVENFVGLAEGTKPWNHPRSGERMQTPYYNGTIFHRVIDGFMIQGGDPLGQGTGGPGYKFADEFHPKLRHDKAGILSMANSGPNTNGGQFFITLAPTRISTTNIPCSAKWSMDVVSTIGGATTGPRDRPVTDIVITSVTIERR